MTGRSGMALIEVLITIAIMSVIAGVASLAVRRIDQPSPNDPLTMLADSSRAAVAGARAITIHPVVDGHATTATLNPDGSVVADSTLDVLRLAGRVANVR